MTPWLWLAVALFALLGVAHSYLGERYLLIRLFRRADLPKLLGSEEFTKRVLRFAWHLTSVAWLGFALLIITSATGNPDASLRVIAATAALSSVVALIGSRARHLSWVIFALIALAVLVSGCDGGSSGIPRPVTL